MNAAPQFYNHLKCKLRTYIFSYVGLLSILSQVGIETLSIVSLLIIINLRSNYYDEKLRVMCNFRLTIGLLLEVKIFIITGALGLGDTSEYLLLLTKLISVTI